MTLTRGDTYPFRFQRLDSEGEAITDTPSSLFFTVKTDYKKSDCILQKKMSDMTMDPDGTWHCVIQPGDTANLAYGRYVYDIEVTTGDYVQTIAKGSLDITKEATWEANK